MTRIHEKNKRISENLIGAMGIERQTGENFEESKTSSYRPYVHQEGHTEKTTAPVNDDELGSVPGRTEVNFHNQYKKRVQAIKSMSHVDTPKLSPGCYEIP